MLAQITLPQMGQKLSKSDDLYDSVMEWLPEPSSEPLTLKQRFRKAMLLTARFLVITLVVVMVLIGIAETILQLTTGHGLHYHLFV